MNGLYQIIGEVLQPIRDKVVVSLHLNRNSLGHKLIHIVGTFILVDFSWIFFRANRLKEAFEIIKQMITVKNPWILVDGSIYNCGLDIKNFWLMVFGIELLLFADYLKYRGIKVREVIAIQNAWFRWIFIAASVCAILLWGKWGPLFDKAGFIYFQF